MWESSPKVTVENFFYENHHFYCEISSFEPFQLYVIINLLAQYHRKKGSQALWNPKISGTVQVKITKEAKVYQLYFLLFSAKKMFVKF